MLVLAFEVGAGPNEQLGEHCGHFRILVKVEEDEVERTVAVFICHVHVHFKWTVGLPCSIKVRLDEFSSEFELRLSECHVQR